MRERGAETESKRRGEGRGEKNENERQQAETGCDCRGRDISKLKALSHTYMLNFSSELPLCFYTARYRAGSSREY